MNKKISIKIFIFLLIFVALCSCGESTPTISSEELSATVAPSYKDIPKLAPYRVISGLHHLYVLYHPELNKRAYLLGEIHTEEGRCPKEIPAINAVDFIYSSIQQSNKFIDLLLEAHPILPAAAAAKAVKGGQPVSFSSPTEDGYLVEINKKLENCYGPKHLCPFPNMRAHWTDLRYYALLNKELQPTYQKSLANIYYFFADRDSLGVSLNLDNIYTIEGIIKFIKSHIKAGKIKKQWQNLPQPYFAKLLEYIETEIYAESFQLLGLTFQIKNFTEKGIVISRKDIYSFLKELAGISYPLTDAYALGRFLREFKEKPNSPFPSRVENGIFFFGAAHTAGMKKYLESIGFIVEQSFNQTLIQGGKTFDLCLSVNGLIKPFSQVP